MLVLAALLSSPLVSLTVAVLLDVDGGLADTLLTTLLTMLRSIFSSSSPRSGSVSCFVSKSE